MIQTKAEISAVEWFKFNSQLQAKKNALRLELKKKGILKKGATNEYDRYKYFSESQYKELFTDLFSQFKLELKFTELEYNTFDGPEKQANGRMPKLRFTLFDVETGFYEESDITGEGIDKGDKAGYKAYTGALKYYLADTFLVATGDDPDKDSPAVKMNDVSRNDSAAKASDKQIAYIMKVCTDAEISALMEHTGITDIKDLPRYKASQVINRIQNRGENNV